MSNKRICDINNDILFHTGRAQAINEHIDKLKSELAELTKEPEWVEIGVMGIWQAKRSPNKASVCLRNTSRVSPEIIEIKTIEALARFAKIPVLSDEMVAKLQYESKKLSREYPEHTRGIDDGSSCLAREILESVEAKQHLSVDEARLDAAHAMRQQTQ